MTLTRSRSFSLGGGLIDETGSVVSMESGSSSDAPSPARTNLNAQVKKTKKSRSFNLNKWTKGARRRFGGKLSHHDSIRTEANTSLGDSASVRDETELDVFLGDDCHDKQYSSMADRQLLQALDEAVEWEKQVAVARILQEMDLRGLELDDPNRQASLQRAADQVQQVLDEHLINPEEQGGWKRQTIMHGKKRDTVIYNRYNDKQEITMRMETPVEASLLVPLLAILNETDLYTTWLPSFQRPFKLGIRCFEKLKQVSRGSQIAMCQVDTPFPMKNRQVTAKISLGEAVDELGVIAMSMQSMEPGQQAHGLTAPDVPEGWESIGVYAGLAFRKCPPDHPALKRHPPSNNKNNNDDPLILASFTITVTPPKNFILKTVAGPAWAALIYLVENVKNGKSAPHKEAIDSKPELYGWINEVVQRITQKCSS